MQAGNGAPMTNKNKLLSVLSDAEQEALFTACRTSTMHSVWNIWH